MWGHPPTGVIMNTMSSHPEIPETLHPLIRDRWSPRLFAPDPISDGRLRDLFEAARWAASSMNEQPWRFILGRRGQDGTWDRLLAVLAEGNIRWAHRAPVLVLAAARQRFERNDRSNRHAGHDTGLAVAQLTLQAVAHGLQVHPMGGFDAAAARREFDIPEDFEPVVVLAIGRVGRPEDAPEDVSERGPLTRDRRPLEQTVFVGTWGEAAELKDERV